MKVCPTCKSEFSGPEAFCPNDGSRLEEQTARGALAAATLGGMVKLERLEHADSMGERYSGRMVEGKRACLVTVFNAAFSPSQNAPRLVETARAKVGSPVPRQLTTLLKVDFTHYPPFVIETAPRGPSLRNLLDERRQLDWKTAVRLTANVARLVEWLSERGVAHHGLHPSSIYVTDLLHGRVQLGEWYSEDRAVGRKTIRCRPLRARAGAVVGYVSYMGPELAMKGRAGICGAPSTRWVSCFMNWWSVGRRLPIPTPRRCCVVISPSIQCGSPSHVESARSTEDLMSS
ncbi:MAG: hypothetical protein R3E66_10480 [bacterium]